MENISTDNNHSIAYFLNLLTGLYVTNSSQVADHCIIYLFSESAQKDYRKRNAATPMSVATIVKL